MTSQKIPKAVLVVILHINKKAFPMGLIYFIQSAFEK